MNADPRLKPDIAALKKRLSEDPGFAAQVTGEQAAMRPELALFFRDLRNYLLHVIDMGKGEHYLDVVRLNAQALIRRMEILAAAQVTSDRPLTPGCRSPEGCRENGCLGWCDEHRPPAVPDSKTPEFECPGEPSLCANPRGCACPETRP